MVAIAIAIDCDCISRIMAPNPQTVAQIKELAAPPPPGTPYALPVPGTEREGRTPVYRHWRFTDKPLLETFDPAIRTLLDIWEDTVKRFPNNRCLGARPWNPTIKNWENKYVWQTYAEVDKRVRNLGSGIFELHRRIGVSPGNHGVGIWSQNRPEWQITGKIHGDFEPLKPLTNRACSLQISL